MNGWWIALAAWFALSVPVALVIGRVIRTADRLARQHREDREPGARDTRPHLPLDRDDWDSA